MKDREEVGAEVGTAVDREVGAGASVMVKPEGVPLVLGELARARGTGVAGEAFPPGPCRVSGTAVCVEVDETEEDRDEGRGGSSVEGEGVDARDEDVGVTDGEGIGDRNETDGWARSVCSALAMD